MRQVQHWLGNISLHINRSCTGTLPLGLPLQRPKPPTSCRTHPAHREKQAALAAEDARRKAAVAQRAQKFKADVAGQLQEKEQARLQQLEDQRRELVQAMEELEVCVSHRVSIWEYVCVCVCAGARMQGILWVSACPAGVSRWRGGKGKVTG